MYCKISDVLTIYDVPLSNHEKKTERGYYNEGEELIIRELISKFKRESKIFFCERIRFI
jgi:IS1 family transposase